MKKIPLEATIIDAYKFFFQNIISIIGTVWFPVVVFVAVVAAFVAGVVPHDWLTGHFAPPTDPDDFVREHLGVIILAVPAVGLAGILTGAMIRVGVLRLALGETTGTTLFYFSLGARVWRMIATVLVFVAIWFVIEIATIALFAVVNFGLHTIAHAPTVVIALCNVVLAIGVAVGVIYTFVRLFFFLPAIVVAENKVGLARSWELGKGNVWRIIVIWLAVVLPVQMVASIIAYATVIPTVLAQAIRTQPQGPAEGLAMLQALWPLIPVIVVVMLCAGLIILGTLFGAIGKAYKAVTADEAA